MSDSESSSKTNRFGSAHPSSNPSGAGFAFVADERLRRMSIWKYLFGIESGLWRLIGAILLGAALTAKGQTNSNPAQRVPIESGTASFYADKYQGKTTASGEIFDMHKLTAAHPRLAFGTVLKVTNTENNRCVTVRVNDRGPFIAGRIIDLSLAAAEELKMVASGLARVTLEIVP
jgi:rare lipoprotein A